MVMAFLVVDSEGDWDDVQEKWFREVWVLRAEVIARVEVEAVGACCEIGGG